MTSGEIIRIAREMDMIDFRDDDSDPHVAQFVDFLVTLVGKAEAAEREACAKLCEQEACGGSAFNSAANYMAGRIRARNKGTTE